MRDRYIWRKQAGEAWLRRHETELLARFAERLALIERPGKKRITVEVSCATRAMAAQIARAFGGNPSRVASTVPPPRNPLKIGDRLAIIDGRRRERFSNRMQLIIPAAGAFGTGEHATTAMCLRMLERMTRRWRNHWTMLDAGTGSGILALAARRFGAKEVTAIDNDPGAIAVAKGNARLNRIRGVQFLVASAIHFRSHQKLDVIAANLFSELLISAIPKWRMQLKRDGVLVLSGILRSQERDVVRALRKPCFALEEIRRRGKWIAILARNQKA